MSFLGPRSCSIKKKLTVNGWEVGSLAPVLAPCQEGGISAVGGTGSIYTFYGPDEPKFKNLTTNFLEKD